MSDVRGPASALTSFLREKNIRIPNTSYSRRRRQQQTEEQDGAADSASNAAAELSTSAASSSRELVLTPDEPAVAGPSGSRSRPRPRPSRAAAAAAAAPAAVPAKRKKPAPAGASMNFDEEDDDDDWHSDEDGGSDSDFKVSSKEAASLGGADTEAQKWQRIKRGEVENISLKGVASGAIDYCPGCSKRFCLTQYTVQTESGGLCHKCGPQYNAAITGGNAAASSSKGKSSAASTKPPPRKKRTIVKRPQDKRVLSTLQHMCINIISDHIEDVEALGGIGDRNIEILSKSICRNRRLNDQTFQLFLEPYTETLNLYDCSRLTPDALATVGVFSPRIHTINLQQCGQLNNAAFDAWTDKLDHLRRLELYGPFLVRKESWHRFLDKVGDRLESLKIRETPRFDLSCVQTLVVRCPGLKELGLAQIGPLNGECLKPLAQLKELTYLDISDPGVSVGGMPPDSLKDDEVIELLSHIGARLEHLDLSGNTELTERVVLEGIMPYCTSLRALRLAKLTNISSASLAKLFESFEQRSLPKLTHVDLTRCNEVGDDAVEALIKHSGPALTYLSINSLTPTTTRGGLSSIATSCVSLRTLDVSFVRKCAEAQVLSLIEGCVSLELLKVFGCNRIPDYVVGTAKCAIVGLERVPVVSQPRTTGGAVV
ncbi:RNI-like protein [Jaminaea rosea]|uniref:RNI-like protein n=1 Tax=Jaminaea rosea TaxID=1569628 RepID=A0A316V0T1_9BASI|nr:RNI-like protein [Jaminaea rosea]PWN31160.1 RNI-like protein [Jaminaea rosea]